MKDLFRFLSPFAPDISGAVSVLFELEGLIVICDAGAVLGIPVALMNHAGIPKKVPSTQLAYVI